MVGRWLRLHISYPAELFWGALSAQLSILCTFGSIIFVDTTFDKVEKLLLTTIMVSANGVSVPCAWLFHMEKDMETYEKFFRWVTAECKGRLNVQWVVGDFDLALRNAAVAVWQCRWIGDWFHFQQVLCIFSLILCSLSLFVNCVKANCRWLHSNGYSHLRSQVAQRLAIVFNSASPDLLRKALDDFLTFAVQIVGAAYELYFRQEWLQVHPPEIWARCYRTPNVPNGDAICEAYHSRLERILGHQVPSTALHEVSFGLTHLQQRADRAVLLLLDDFKHTQLTLTTPKLLEAHKRALATKQKYLAGAKRRCQGTLILFFFFCKELCVSN